MTFEDILALLTSKFTGVRKDGLEHLARTLALQCSDEAEAKPLVEKLTDAQVNDFVKEYRRVVDKEVLDGNKTFEANLRKKFDFVEKGTPAACDRDGGDDLSVVVSTAISEAVKPLEERLERYEQGLIEKSRLSALRDTLSACKDEVFKSQTLQDFSRMRFETEESFSEYLQEKESAVRSVNQVVADHSLGSGSWRPHRSSSNTEGTVATASELDAVVDRLPI